MLKWGIRNRLIISFLVLTIVTLSVLGGYILWYFYRHNLSSLTNNLLVNAQVTEQLLLQSMHSTERRGLIDEQIKELSTKNELRITIIDSNGTVLADSWENPAVMENHSARPEIIDAIRNGSGSAIRYSTTINQNLLYTAIPIRQNGELLGVVRTASTLAYVDEGFNQIKSAVLAVILCTSVLAILLSFRLARNYTAPLEAITAAAQDIGNGDLDRRVHIRTGDELEFEADTLNNLASNLDDKIKEVTAETKKFSLILQHMDNAVILLNRYGRVTTANKMAREVFGINSTMLGQHNMHVIGNSLLSQSIDDTINTMEHRLIDLKITLNGSKRVFQVFLAPITAAENDITGVLTVFHDITAMQEIHERQADFIANASHELSTPLTAIKGFAETLLDGALQDEKLSTKFITIIHTEAERMHRLVKDLLQLAKLNSNQYCQQLSMESVKLNELIDMVIHQLEQNAFRKQQIIQFSPKEPVTLIANADCLKQVLVNLIDNSIKYTPSAGAITLDCFRSDGMVTITVKDTGLGIPPQDVPLIFDRFYRVERARTRTTGGTGLGLAIVKFIVEMHGGPIQVESEVNVGTLFTITLPEAGCKV